MLVISDVLAQSWESEFYRDHPLVDKIWDTHKNTWITKKRLYTELLEYDYILLGETHNNKDHHILQAHILNSMVTAGVKPTVVMEMLAIESWKDQPQLWDDLATLQYQARSKNKGWPWELYIPVLESVVTHQLELVAGNIRSKELHEWSNLIGPYTPEEVITEYWITPQSFEQLKKDIVASHCGYANASIVNFMARAQLQRDRIITSSLTNNKTPVVLISGTGHVRNNYAVPMQLQNTHRKLSYLSIAFIPVQLELIEPMNYISESPKEFDILFFTPNHTNQDPCVVFKEQLQNLPEMGTH